MEATRSTDSEQIFYVAPLPNTTDQKLNQMAEDLSRIFKRKVRVVPLGPGTPQPKPGSE